MQINFSFLPLLYSARSEFPLMLMLLQSGYSIWAIEFRYEKSCLVGIWKILILVKTSKERFK